MNVILDKQGNRRGRTTSVMLPGELYTKHSLDWQLQNIARDLSEASGLEVRWFRNLADDNPYGDRGHFIWQDMAFKAQISNLAPEKINT